MECIGIIPARYKATRFEGKIIADLCGKPIIQHVYENVSKSKLLNRVLISTDDSRISKIAESFGAEVIMTSKKPRSGTERIIETIKKIDLKADIIINIQGDEPFIKFEMVDQLAKCLMDNKILNVATLRKKIIDREEIFDPNVVKVVVDKNGFALYFSRSTIPYNKEKNNLDNFICYKHIGIYGYKKTFLDKFKELSVFPLEKNEKLEQLRILENGFKIKTIQTKYNTIGIDTKEDLEKAEKILINSFAD